ncbi:alpha-ribazole phosphatase [Flavobacterium agrisoli]|uniref:Alpha-ribazole phosphatase n=1 Tax=Flavobacterium agrisoli TaxID=2793066 RepID=A0A934UKQ1_9FLAO|nr:alpha-ribazole phosphatase [Flavobacterium agrisoli]MBK0371207.1 alpha-ribazole phosphatase [Flavobacterium agrisoli]
MEIYLVRHTETVVPKGICYGQTDVAIAQPYDTAFEKIATQLPHNAVLFSSPLQRCLQLAHYLQLHNKTEKIQVDARLMEMHFGDWEMQAWNEIPTEILNPWMTDFVSVAVPNGESFEKLHQRVLDFIESEIKNLSTQNVIIVAHAGIIRSILCYFEQIPLAEAFATKVDFGAVIRTEYPLSHSESKL